MNAEFEPRLSDDEELLTRLIDGELPEGFDDVEGHLASNPEIQHEVQAARELGQMLRQGLAGSTEPPAGDNFTRNIMDKLDRS